MTFEEIMQLVIQNYDLPKHASLTEQCAYHSLKCLNYEYKNKLISREKASRQKKLLIRTYEEQKQYDKARHDQYQSQVQNIKLSEQIRSRINHAANNREISKELFLDAVKCIGLMCGNMSQFESVMKKLEGIEYEESKASNG